MRQDYQTKQESIAVSGVDNVSICSLLDRNQFSDPFGHAERLGISSAMWPIFGLLWPSGTRLAERMALRPVVHNERILEIGCGLALASIVAHRAGANITASDCHPLAARFLRNNLRLNHMLPMTYLHGQWGASAPVKVSASALDAVPPNLALYDLVIGSDVLYERDSKGCLAQFVGAQCAPVAQVWIIDPDRSNRSAFSARMLALGFLVREERLDSAAAQGKLAYKGRLLCYSRSG